MLSSIAKNFSKAGYVLKCSSIFKSNKSLNAFINSSIGSNKNPNSVKSATSFNKSLNACQAGFTIDRCSLLSISSRNFGKGPNFLPNAFEGKRFKSSKSIEAMKWEIIQIKFGMFSGALEVLLWAILAYGIYRIFNGEVTIQFDVRDGKLMLATSDAEATELEPLTVEKFLKALNIKTYHHYYECHDNVCTEVKSDSSNTNPTVQLDDVTNQIIHKITSNYSFTNNSQKSSSEPENVEGSE